MVKEDRRYLTSDTQRHKRRSAGNGPARAAALQGASWRTPETRVHHTGAKTHFPRRSGARGGDGSNPQAPGTQLPSDQRRVKRPTHGVSQVSLGWDWLNIPFSTNTDPSSRIQSCHGQRRRTGCAVRPSLVAMQPTYRTYTQPLLDNFRAGTRRRSAAGRTLVVLPRPGVGTPRSSAGIAGNRRSQPCWKFQRLHMGARLRGQPTAKASAGRAQPKRMAG